MALSKYKLQVNLDNDLHYQIALLVFCYCHILFAQNKILFEYHNINQYLDYLFSEAQYHYELRHELAQYSSYFPIILLIV